MTPNENPLRPLLPALAKKEVPAQGPSLPKTQRRRMACTSCRIKRVKCVGSPPSCEECIQSGSQCLFNPHEDKRRKEYWEKIQNDARVSQDMIMQIISFMQHGTYDQIIHLTEKIRRENSPERAIECLRSFLFRSEAQPGSS